MLMIGVVVGSIKRRFANYMLMIGVVGSIPKQRLTNYTLSPMGVNKLGSTNAQSQPGYLRNIHRLTILPVMLNEMKRKNEA